MRKRNLVITSGLLVALALSAIAIAIASASTTTITPAGDNMLATSGNVVLLIGGEDPVTCTLTQIGGTVPSPAQASMTLDLPYFQNIGSSSCTGKMTKEGKTAEASVTARGSWTLTAATTTTGSITLPEKEAITIKWKGCTLINEGRVTLPVTFKAGEKTSQLQYSKSVLTLTAENFPLIVSGECPFVESEDKSYLRISGQFVVNDGTHLNEPVKF